MTPYNRSIGVAVTIFLLGAGCARSAPPRAETPARLKDSAPEKIAAQRAAGPPGLNLEREDERWGIEAARERKRAAPPETPPPGPAVTGPTNPKPLDIHKQP
jgi:hypothetical protein